MQRQIGKLCKLSHLDSCVEVALQADACFLLSNDFLKAQSPLDLKGWEPPREEILAEAASGLSPTRPSALSHHGLGIKKLDSWPPGPTSLRLNVLRGIALLSNLLAQRQSDPGSLVAAVVCVFSFLESSVLATVLGPWSHPRVYLLRLCGLYVLVSDAKKSSEKALRHIVVGMLLLL